jgi:hypothetical protein
MGAGYRRMARALKELDLGEVTPLDEAIPELYDEPSSNTPGTLQASRGPLGEMANAGDLKSSVSKEMSRFESGRGHSVLRKRGVQRPRAFGDRQEVA